MNRELLQLVGVALFILAFMGFMLRGCWECETTGGVYVRTMAGHVCVDPSALRPPR